MFGLFLKRTDNYSHLDLDLVDDLADTPASDDYGIISDWTTTSDVWATLSEADQLMMYQHQPAAARRGIIRSKLLIDRPLYISNATQMVNNALPNLAAAQRTEVTRAVINVAMNSQYTALIDEAEKRAADRARRLQADRRHTETLESLRAIKQSINQMNVVDIAVNFVKAHPFLTGLLLP